MWKELCQVFHVIKIYLEEAIVGAKENKLSRTSVICFYRTKMFYIEKAWLFCVHV